MTQTQTQRRARRKRGYTAVELLMSISVLGIGVTGVVAMQKVTVTSNQHAKNLALATQIGQAWMEQLRADALQWNHPSAANSQSDIGSTTWLKTIAEDDGAGNDVWFRPGWDAERQFGPGFDAQGDPTANAGATRFCTNLRLAWLYGPIGFVGSQLIRAEVRVYWLRDGQAPDDAAFCAEDPTEVGAQTSRYHMVYDASAIRQNSF